VRVLISYGIFKFWKEKELNKEKEREREKVTITAASIH
jgi:hypothetical protein